MDSRFHRVIERFTELSVFSNEITELPQNLGNLTDLLVLNVANNLISTIPESINNLSQLHTLNLAMNPIQKFPQTFWDLFFRSFDFTGPPFKIITR